ncbi:MAG: hypothetical protein U1F46_13160 [Marinagarivorans sp.]
MEYTAQYFEKYDGNWARWHSTNTAVQENYKTAINAIKARFTDEFKSEK